MTSKRFSATQYALFSSLFALPRVIAGPLTGFLVAAVGWPAFFLSTMVIGIPGLVMLARFAPPGVREPGHLSDEDAGPVEGGVATAAEAQRAGRVERGIGGARES